MLAWGLRNNRLVILPAGFGQQASQREMDPRKHCIAGQPKSFGQPTAVLMQRK